MFRTFNWPPNKPDSELDKIINICMAGKTVTSHSETILPNGVRRVSVFYIDKPTPN